MDQKTIVNAQRVFEELGVQTILPALGDDVDLHVTLEYSEETSHAKMMFYHNANVDLSETADSLPLLLVQNASVEVKSVPSEAARYLHCVQVKLK